MDFLNKAYQQVADLFQSMTPGARITAGLLLAVVVISLTYLVRYQTTGSNEFLLGGREFSESDLADIEAAFGQANLGDYRRDGNRIRVPQGQKAVYMAALADANALPEDFTGHLDDALTGGGFLGTPRHLLEQKVKHAKEQQLSHIISEMKGIDVAHVKFEMDKKPGLRGAQETRALAAVRLKANNHLDEERIDAIRNTVVAGVAGLKPENVTVTDLNADTAYSGHNASGIPGGLDSSYAAAKRYHENQYRQKIERMLRDYQGVVVGVNVEVDETIIQEETTTTYDEPTPIRLSETISNSVTTNGGSGGRPGVVPNSGSSNQAMAIDSTSATESTIDKSTNERESVPGGSIRKKTISGHKPVRVSASIGVPRSYYAKVWLERNPPADAQTPPTPDAADLTAIEQETKDKIKELIVGLLPIRIKGEDPYEHVVVQTIDKLPVQPIVEPSMAETATGWLAGNWQTFGMALIGLVSLFMLRGMIRSTTSQPPPTSERTPQLQSIAPVDTVRDENEEEIENATRLRFGAAGPNLRTELAQLVKEDPEAAANVLKNWIGDAA